MVNEIIFQIPNVSDCCDCHAMMKPNRMLLSTNIGINLHCLNIIVVCVITNDRYDVGVNTYVHKDDDNDAANDHSEHLLTRN